MAKLLRQQTQKNQNIQMTTIRPVFATVMPPRWTLFGWSAAGTQSIESVWLPTLQITRSVHIVANVLPDIGKVFALPSINRNNILVNTTTSLESPDEELRLKDPPELIGTDTYS
jgi:hypothetical protein